MNSLCENTWYLQRYENEQDILEQKWIDSLPEKREQIIDYAIKALEGYICPEEHDWIFAKYTNSDEGYDKLADILDDWNEGNVAVEDEIFLNEVALVALEGASGVLYDESLYEIASYGEFSINKMILEVVG